VSDTPGVVSDCLFCGIVAGDIPSDIVHETETTVAFTDIAPAGVADPDRGYRLIFNIGPDAMNSIPHLHLHVLGGEPLKGHFALA
jgi:histidine triad (HIT) family protein